MLKLKMYMGWHKLNRQGFCLKQYKKTHPKMILTKISLCLTTEQAASLAPDCAWISTGSLLSKGSRKTSPFKAQTIPGKPVYIHQPGLIHRNSPVTWLQANGSKGRGDVQAWLLPLWTRMIGLSVFQLRPCDFRPISSYLMFFLISDVELPLTCKDQPYAGEPLAFLDLPGPVNHGVNVNT